MQLSLPVNKKDNVPILAHVAHLQKNVPKLAHSENAKIFENTSKPLDTDFVVCYSWGKDKKNTAPAVRVPTPLQQTLFNGTSVDAKL